MKKTNTDIDDYTNELSYQVVGAALEVHRLLGPGLLEEVYEKALCVELRLRKIPYEKQKEISITYKNEIVGVGRVDILVDNCIILELKSVEHLIPIHTAQLLTYLKITGVRLGLLINFNTYILKEGIRRVVL